MQHDIEDWVGYSYAWNEAGTDAQLVKGNRVAPLAGGKSWYFPSSTDCTACHTPAAGYTLGLEAKQLAGHGDALAKLEAKIAPPIDTAALATLVPVAAPAPATNEARVQLSPRELLGLSSRGQRHGRARRSRSPPGDDAREPEGAARLGRRESGRTLVDLAEAGEGPYEARVHGSADAGADRSNELHDALDDAEVASHVDLGGAASQPGHDLDDFAVAHLRDR